MEVKDSGHGRISPVSEERVLLAIGRAGDHASPGREGRVHRADVARHLGLVHNSATTKKLRPFLGSLEAAGLIEAERKRGADYWELTKKGSAKVRRLRRSAAGERLPESPQHRNWREGQRVAAERLPEIIERLEADLKEGMALRRTDFQVFMRGERTREELRRVGRRIEVGFDLFATGLRCLFEWPEPPDAKRDPRSTSRWSDLLPDSIARKGLK